jgi:secondary thiamine-phosphate synthase enzyme
MSVETAELEISTRGAADIVDITQGIIEAVENSGIETGIVTVFLPGSTAALTTVEYEAGLVSDVKAAFDRLVPLDQEYQHDRRWQDGNGAAHVRATLLGPSLTIPFRRKHLFLGKWQQVVLVDFDNRPRNRHLVLQIMGD